MDTKDFCRRLNLKGCELNCHITHSNGRGKNYDLSELIDEEKLFELVSQYEKKLQEKARKLILKDTNPDKRLQDFQKFILDKYNTVVLIEHTNKGIKLSYADMIKASGYTFPTIKSIVDVNSLARKQFIWDMEGFILLNEILEKNEIDEKDFLVNSCLTNYFIPTILPIISKKYTSNYYGICSSLLKIELSREAIDLYKFLKDIVDFDLLLANDHDIVISFSDNEDMQEIWDKNLRSVYDKPNNEKPIYLGTRNYNVKEFLEIAQEIMKNNKK